MLIYGVRYDIEPPGLGQAMQDALKQNGWAEREDGAYVGLFGSAQEAATTFDRLANMIGARVIARYVFEHLTDRFVPVLPEIP